MNFLEATRTVRAFGGGPSLPFLLAMSGTADTLTVYLQAVGATRGVAAEPRYLPFGTLQQAVYGQPEPGTAEVLVLLPWDVIPELDWRSGVPATSPDDADIRARASAFIKRITQRGARVLYVPAPCPPVWMHPAHNAGLVQWAEATMRSHDAEILSAAHFSLSSYLSNGNAIAGSHAFDLATRIVDAVLRDPPVSAKVLVTDLDNTMWAGIVGDDGVDAVAFRAEGRGYRHFLYQTLLLRLKHEGVLLAAVSKNDASVALAPFETGSMVLQSSDFVAFLASWNAKSSQIVALADQLNLGLDAFVFVDDNPVELAEVAAASPAVHGVLFPKSEKEFPELVDRLVTLFARTSVSSEDRDRTELYRRRLESLPPQDTAGGDIASFLRDLQMSLTVTDRSATDRTRAIQLLNKTNQFNLNGRRLTEEEVEQRVSAGSRVFTCLLEDRTGSHGEVLTAVVDANGVITSLVMSCRVFQRRVEYAFLAWLATSGVSPTALDYARTERNTALTEFVREATGAEPADGLLPLNAIEIATRYAADRALFRWTDA